MMATEIQCSVLPVEQSYDPLKNLCAKFSMQLRMLLSYIPTQHGTAWRLKKACPKDVAAENMTKVRHDYGAMAGKWHIIRDAEGKSIRWLGARSSPTHWKIFW